MNLLSCYFSSQSAWGLYFYCFSPKAKDIWWLAHNLKHLIFNEILKYFGKIYIQFIEMAVDSLESNAPVEFKS